MKHPSDNQQIQDIEIKVLDIIHQLAELTRLGPYLPFGCIPPIQQAHGEMLTALRYVEARKASDKRKASTKEGV